MPCFYAQGRSCQRMPTGVREISEFAEEIPVVSVQDVSERLFFLRPIEELESSTTDPDQLFWSEISGLVNPEQVELLKQIRNGKLSAERLTSLGLNR